MIEFFLYSLKVKKKQFKHHTIYCLLGNDVTVDQSVQLCNL